MTGGETAPSRWLQLLAVTMVAATAFSAGWFEPAEAHTLNSNRRERRHIKKRARNQLGTPYRYGGSSPRGFDCSGLTMWVFDGHGANLPHNSMDQFQLPRRRDGFRRVWKRKRLRKGDLVFHKTTSARVGHAGIYIGRGKFISSTSSRGVRVQSIWDPYYWGRRWVGGVRVPALRT